jgi:nucleoid DNA-binding protein
MVSKSGKPEVNIWAIARKVGLDCVMCPHCEKKINASLMLESFFNKILEECKNGKVVKIKNFGSFDAREIRARVIKSPVLKGGQALMNKAKVLRFNVTNTAKNFLNDRQK